MYGPVLVGLGGFKRDSLVADRALRKNIFLAHRTRVCVECPSAFVEVAAHPVHHNREKFFRIRDFFVGEEGRQSARKSYNEIRFCLKQLILLCVTAHCFV
jgi:hypothetical protein